MYNGVAHQWWGECYPEYKSCYVMNNSERVVKVMESEITNKSQIVAYHYAETRIVITDYTLNKANEAKKDMKRNERQGMPEIDVKDQYIQSLKSVFEERDKKLDDWEEISIPEIGGLTPAQYFDTIESIQDLIELTSFFMKYDEIKIPYGLMLKIKNIDSKDLPYLHDALSAMKPKDNKDINEYQLAVLLMLDLLALPEFIPDLISLFDSIDVDRHPKMSVRVMSVFSIGKPALDPLFQKLENYESPSDVIKKHFLMMIISKIGKDNKSDRIYKMLKEQFRKDGTNVKVVIANDLATYGDSRAVTSIREYVEKNKKDIEKDDYLQFRKSILTLGGSVEALDKYFDIDSAEEEE